MSPATAPLAHHLSGRAVRLGAVPALATSAAVLRAQAAEEGSPLGQR